MQDFQFMAPQADILIGPWLTRKVQQVRVISSRKNPVDLAMIEIPIDGVEVNSIAKGMPVDIRLGYREHGVWQVFTGVVTDVKWGPMVKIEAKDGMEKLRETPIKQTFVDTQPREVLKFCFQKAGVNFEICSDEKPLKHYFVAGNCNVLQVQKRVCQTWGLDWEFYREPEGQIVCQPWNQTARYNQGKPAARLEYGKNILDLTTSDHESGTVKTFLLPMIRHGHIVELVDRRFWATETKVKIERIEYTHGENGAGMVMEWRKIREQ